MEVAGLERNGGLKKRDLAFRMMESQVSLGTVWSGVPEEDLISAPTAGDGESVDER